MTLNNIISILKPFFREHGFKQSGAWFYRIENDISFCVTLQKAGLLYCSFCIIPLYMPATERYLTYGDRLSNVLNCSELNLNLNNAAQTDAMAWICRLKQSLEECIFPFHQSISSPQRLVELLSQDRHTIFCTPLEAATLMAYSSFYLGNEELFRQSIVKAYELLSTAIYLAPRLRDEQNEKLTRLVDVFEGGDEERQAYINKMIAESRYNCRF